MRRVLFSIPGVTVEENAVVRAKAGGYAQVPFRILIRNESISAQSIWSTLFQGGAREFWVHQNHDGTFFVEVSHDVGAAQNVVDAVQNALSQNEVMERENRKQIAAEKRAEQEQLRLQREQRERQKAEAKERRNRKNIGDSKNSRVKSLNRAGEFLKPSVSVCKNAT